MRIICLLMGWLVLTTVAAADTAPTTERPSAVLNLEPSKEFPRNSEGAFITLKSGKILFVYTQFLGGARDHSPAHLVAIHSDDLGHTWSKEPEIVVPNRGAANVMSVSLLRLKSGRIALFYLLKNSWVDCRPHVQFSGDEGRTWSPPLLMCEAPGYFVMNNDRVIQLKGGRLVAPLASHRTRGTDPHSSRSFDSRAIALWLLSDDDGRTWREADTWVALPVVPTRTGLQEPGVVELADGRLLGWFRTDQGSQFRCVSSDSGRTWTQPEASELQSPTSPASIKLRPGATELVAVWNDHSGKFPMVKARRTPLVVGVSHDSGSTWPQRKLLEDDPDGWYCYTAMHFTEDALLLAYCAGDSKIGGLNRLRIRRVPLNWLPAP